LSCALVVAGLLASVYAWQSRHPLTTSDFMLFYRSASLPVERMYDPPPGPPRNNMNPPHFQLLIRPLTWLSPDSASQVFRALSIACLCVCVGWIARSSGDRWTAGDLGALLAWAPMTVMLSLNQITWLIWPLLVCAWWCWRNDRWTAGAVAFGIALSFKPFLLVVPAWLLVSGRVRVALSCGLTTAAVFTATWLYYGTDVFMAWISAMGHVQWWGMGLNASLMGWLTRMTAGSNNAVPALPAAVRWIGTFGSAAVLAVTAVVTRRWPVDRAWLPLMAAALLASPLGWIYYAWWLLPGDRPTRLLVLAPTLWLPFGLPGLPTMTAQPVKVMMAATIGSGYFFGLLTIWISHLRWRDAARSPDTRSTADSDPHRRGHLHGERYS
jgi:hypothetical protein